MQSEKTQVCSSPFETAAPTRMRKIASGQPTEVGVPEESLLPDPPLARASPLLACIGISALLHLALFVGVSAFLWSRGSRRDRAPASRLIAINLLRADARHASASLKKRDAVPGPQARAWPDNGPLEKDPSPKVFHHAVSSTEKTRTLPKQLRTKKSPEFVTDHSENPGALIPDADQGPKDRPPVPRRHAQTEIAPIGPFAEAPAGGGQAGREKRASAAIRQAPPRGRGDPVHPDLDRPVSSTPARVLLLSKPAYPAFSRRKGEEGRVRLALVIREDGRVQRVELLRSSGYSRLDKAAVRAAKAASFVPATRAGHPVSSTKKIFFTFKLREGR